jgi:hypothetical protein
MRIEKICLNMILINLITKIFPLKKSMRNTKHNIIQKLLGVQITMGYIKLKNQRIRNNLLILIQIFKIKILLL